MPDDAGVSSVGAPPMAIRVLIADPDDAARLAIRAQLAGFGHTVVGEFASLAEAVDHALALSPDVVLLNVQAVNGGEIESAQTIAQGLPEVAVILVTDEPVLPLSDRDLARTTAIAILPKSTPPRVMDSTIRLAVHRARELRSARAEVVDLRKQLENRKAIERAKGILMRRTGLSEQEAYRILQRTSQDRSVPMAEVAKEVLESEPAR